MANPPSPSLPLTDRTPSGLVCRRQRGCHRARVALGLVLPLHGRDGAGGRGDPFDAREGGRSEEHPLHHVPVLQQGVFVDRAARGRFAEPSLDSVDLSVPPLPLSGHKYLSPLLVPHRMRESALRTRTYRRIFRSALKLWNHLVLRAKSVEATARSHPDRSADKVKPRCRLSQQCMPACIIGLSVFLPVCRHYSESLVHTTLLPSVTAATFR